MAPKPKFLTAAKAAARLGVSAKALRLYEQRGLLAPGRTISGWRSYGPEAMKRASEIARLRKLGLSLAEIGQLLKADAASRGALLSSHETRLEIRKQQLDATLRAVNRERSGRIDGGDKYQSAEPFVAFDLPWPWDGERFELASLSPLTFITGPLGSGKTRFAIALAQALPNGRFLGLDRSAAVTGHSRPDEQARWTQTLKQVGAAASPALSLVMEAIYAGPPGPLVVDMVEQDLDHATQEALLAVLRHHWPPKHPLFLMTRSSAILDLSKVESGEAIIYCPANHSPPVIARAVPGYPGYEAVAMCLASPDVRARTKGVVAVMETPPSSRDSRETFC